MIDLTTITARKALGQKYASKYLLDPALVCAVAEHESSWNPWAVRYEPAFYERYITLLHLASQTEAQGRAFSYGLMQIMGETARELGFTDRFLTGLCDPDAGMDFGCKKLAKCVDAHPGDVAAALLAYNGGGDPNYPNLVMPLMANYY